MFHSTTARDLPSVLFSPGAVWPPSSATNDQYLSVQLLLMRATFSCVATDEVALAQYDATEQVS